MCMKMGCTCSEQEKADKMTPLGVLGAVALGLFMGCLFIAMMIEAGALR